MSRVGYCMNGDKARGFKMAEEKEWREGMSTHECIIFSYFGGLSNTGITSALACLEAVKELGLEKAAYRVSALGTIKGKTRFRED